MECPVSITENSSPGWLGRPPTIDEQEILAFIKGRESAERILHVGVGNGLFSENGFHVVQAVTKDGGESALWRSKGLNTILCNKYDTAAYAEKLIGPFSCIIDVNIRSYACCDTHFVAYMALMLNSLRWNGRLLTSIRGLDYLKPTSLSDLKKLCPSWSIIQIGQIVVMRPGFFYILKKCGKK